MKAFDYSLVKDPQYFCDNRMEAHSDHVYYRDGNEMQTAVQDGTETSFRYSLNGLWKFHYARNYKSAVQGFEKEDYCCYDWEDIHVQTLCRSCAVPAWKCQPFYRPEIVSRPIR